MGKIWSCRPIWRGSLVSLAVVLAFVAGGSDIAKAEPDTVVAGHDLLETDSSATYQMFPASDPLPGVMFGTGCNDFSGTVFLEGDAFDSFGGQVGLEPTDTIVERLEDAGPAFPDTIEIEIVRLELVSVAPLTITGCDGGDQTWEMRAHIEEGNADQIPGSMTIRHEYPDGGTFDTLLPVNPRVTFTRLDVAGPVIGPFYLPEPLQFTTYDRAWCHTAKPLDQPAGHRVVEKPPLTSNFFPGITCPDSEGSGGLRKKTMTPEQALLAAHGVLPAETTGVGGTVELADGDTSPLATTDSPGGSSSPPYAAIAGAAAAAAALAAVVTGGWYTRRRWMR